MTAKKTDNRQRPHIYRVLPEVDGLVRAYAAKLKIKPNEAAEHLINGNAGRIVDGAEVIKRLTKENADLIDSHRSAMKRASAEDRAAGLTGAREQNERQQAEIERLTAAYEAAQATARAASKDAAETERERDAERKVSADLRTDLESAREATRRADAEVERLTRELTISEENTAAAVRLVERRESELAAARSGAPQPCACALPDDLAPRLATIAARRSVAPDVMLANVIKNGISKIEASDKYQDAQKAARARA